MRETFIDDDGVEVVVVEPHWCMTLRVFRGFHEPDACPTCLRPFPDKPWDPDDVTPVPEPEWVSVGLSRHNEPPYLRHRILAADN